MAACMVNSVSRQVQGVLFGSQVNRNCSCAGYTGERDRSQSRFQLEMLGEWLHNWVGIFAAGPNLDCPRALLWTRVS